MGAVILGAVALLVIVIVLRAFVSVDPKLLVKSLRYFGVGLLLLIALFLALIERFTFALLAAGLALALYTRGRVWLLPGPFGFFGYFSHRPQQTGSTTRVRTEWVEMTLDHDTGTMAGRVLKGIYASQPLDDLTEDEAILFFLEAGHADPETANLLTAYLDRRFGADWHAKAESAAASKGNAQGRPDSGMSRAEAFIVLGLNPGASEDEIRAAHRKLMLKNHPDLGGSGEAAAKINEAKDVLLRS